ncbi:MAG: type II toxin-antitoxin system HicA family toxin [Alphaproteobacteria bacterium]|nr:type II toxin-antitoxin system HicA family toxin [Alphaproteobacteria bacterium]
MAPKKPKTTATTAAPVRVHKSFEKMRANPKDDWTIADVKKIARSVGIDVASPRGGGSHYKLMHSELMGPLTMPYKRPIKPFYIKLFVKMVLALIEEQNEEGTDD